MKKTLKLISCLVSLATLFLCMDVAYGDEYGYCSTVNPSDNDFGKKGAHLEFWWKYISGNNVAKTNFGDTTDKPIFGQYSDIRHMYSTPGDWSFIYTKYDVTHWNIRKGTSVLINIRCNIRDKPILKEYTIPVNTSSLPIIDSEQKVERDAPKKNVWFPTSPGKLEIYHTPNHEDCNTEECCNSCTLL